MNRWNQTTSDGILRSSSSISKVVQSGDTILLWIQWKLSPTSIGCWNVVADWKLMFSCLSKFSHLCHEYDEVELNIGFYLWWKTIHQFLVHSNCLTVFMWQMLGLIDYISWAVFHVENLIIIIQMKYKFMYININFKGEEFIQLFNIQEKCI